VARQHLLEAAWHRFGPEEVVLKRGVGVRPPRGVEQEELVEEVAGALVLNVGLKALARPKSASLRTPFLVMRTLAAFMSRWMILLAWM